MAIFKDKTGRGEVNYAKSPVQGSDGTILYLNDHTGTQKGIYAEGLHAHTVFQLRGSSAGVEDISDNKFSVTESSELTKRLENVDHKTKLNTFEFSGGKTLTLNPEIPLSVLQDGYWTGTSALGLRYNYLREAEIGDGTISHILPNRLEYYEGTYAAREKGRTDVIISFWIYPEDYGANGSCIMETVNGNSRSLGIILTDNGQLTFRYYDWGATTGPSNAVDFQQVTTAKKLNKKTWYHITIFAKGYTNDDASEHTNAKWNTNGLNEAHQGYEVYQDQQPQVEIYINGSLEINTSVAGKTSGTFSGSLINTSANLPLVIGTGLGDYDSDSGGSFGNAANFQGRLAEISYFYTRAIQDSLGSAPTRMPLAQAVFYRNTIASALFSGGSQPTSGITNISERLLLRDLDHDSTHPTVKRPGDPRRLGNHSIKFDDSRAQTLKGATVQYPTKLVQGDNLIDSIYEGYFSGDLTLSHTASVDSYDTFYRRADQPAHEPFIESRVYIDSGSIFYQTGTLESVLPGFNGPLHNKDYIVIDLSTSTVTEMYTRTINDERLGTHTQKDGGSTTFTKYDQNGENHFTDRSHRMCYWAPATATEPARWELIGVGDRALSANQFESAGQEQIQNLLNTGCIGFGPGNFELTLTGTLAPGATNTLMKSTLELVGRPISMFGFPSHPKYHATGSQGILLSDYICEPFLAEKYVLLDVKTTVQGPDKTSAGTGVVGWSNKFGLNDFISPENLAGFRGGATGALPITSMMSTFFMLRQKKGTEAKRFNTKVITPDLDKLSVYYGYSNRYPQSNGPDHGQFVLTSSIPTTIALTSGTIENPAPRVFVDTTRELLGYAQVINYHEDHSDSGYFGNRDSRFQRVSMTGSNHPIEINHDGRYEQLAENSDGLLNDGLGRNAAISQESSFKTASTSVFSMSGSFNVTRKYDGVPPKFSFNLWDKTTNRISTNLTETVWVGPEHSLDVFVNSYEGGRSPGDLTATTSFSSAVVGTVPGGTFEYSILDANAYPLSVGAGGVASNDEAKAANLFVSENFNADANVESAPVVLSPDDKLILGWQCDPGKGRFDKGTLQVGGDNAKLIIYGTFVKNSQPRQFQLNQMLNNDIVHEAIGQEPISDQFDIEPRGAFTGSYVDEVMSGSVTAPYRGFNASIHVDGAGSSDFTDLARRVIGRSSEGTQGVTGSLRRNLSITSLDKTEYDSFLFDLQSVFEQDGEGGFSRGSLASSTDPPEAQPLSIGVGSSGNTSFVPSYLFNRYPSVARVRSNQIFTDPEDVNLQDSGRALLPYADTAVNYSSAGFQAAWMPRVSKLKSVLVQRFLFGLGNDIQSGHIRHIEFDFTGMGDPVPVGFFPQEIRGFRYGLSNVVDKKPRNVFRRDRYGQLRDMLEMSPNTAYLDDKTNTISYPIEAQFFADDGSIASPDATNSSNLSTYCTSSAPFFDREVVEFTDPSVVRNRGPFNNQVVDVTIEI